MKEYSISKWAFVAICLLICSLPVSRHWKILATGEKAKGRVERFVLHKEEVLVGESKLYYASEIVFEVDGALQKAYGPANYAYKTGRQVKVFYQGNNPSENCIFTFSGFYLDGYTVLPIVLLVLWAAFYMSFNNYQRKQRFKRVKYGPTANKKGQKFTASGGIIGGPIQSARKLTGSKNLSTKK